MANFDPIAEWLLRQEDSTLSGEVVNLGDGVGRTRYGITEKNNPGLPKEFWGNEDGAVMSNDLALPLAKNAYRKAYWVGIHGDAIRSDIVAAPVFSAAVNCGVIRATRLLQFSLGTVPIDGVFGKQTLDATNAADQGALAAIYRVNWGDFYVALAQRIPANERFLKGWLNRAHQAYNA